MAVEFTNASLHEYAGLCFLGASKCEKALNNTLAEVHFLLRSARSYVAADQQVDRLQIRSNANEYVEGALSCYNQAILLLDDDSVMRAAIIREIKRIHPNCELTSNFVSPAHRIHDLDIAANENIRTGDYVSALDKLTEIHEDITERKVQHFYGHILRTNEVTRVLLLLVLRLPPARQAPSNVKLLQKFTGEKAAGLDTTKSEASATPDDKGLDATEEEILAIPHIDYEEDQDHTCLITDSLGNLIDACKHEVEMAKIRSHIQVVASIPGLTAFQQILLRELRIRHQ